MFQGVKSKPPFIQNICYDEGDPRPTFTTHPVLCVHTLPVVMATAGARATQEGRGGCQSVQIQGA